MDTEAPDPSSENHSSPNENTASELIASGVGSSSEAATVSLVDQARREYEGARMLREALEAQAVEAKDASGRITKLEAELVEIAKVAREHAAQLSLALAASETSTAQAIELGRQATAAIESMKAATTSSAEILGRLEVTRDEAVKAQAMIAEKNAHVEGGLKHINKVKAEMDAALEQVTRAAESAERCSGQGKAAMEATTEALNAAKAAQERASAESAGAAAAKVAAEESARETTALQDVSRSVEARVTGYEVRLEELIAASEAQRTKINELLSGATDAGLASAFDKRSAKFKNPERLWHATFVVSLLGLIGLAGWQAYSYTRLEELPDWHQVARMLAIKVPFAGPLVWLAIYSARQAALAKRLEEEYAFKATISRSFDGYRRQMAEVGKDLASGSPLAVLCNNTLQGIAASPGRVYEGQRIDPNLATSTAEALKPILEKQAKAISDKIESTGR